MSSNQPEWKTIGLIDKNAANDTTIVHMANSINESSNENVISGTNANTNIDINANDNVNINANVNVNADTNTNTNANTNTDTSTNTNTNANTNTNTGENTNGEGNKNSDPDKKVAVTSGTVEYKLAYEILTKREKKLIFISICMGMFLSSLDQLCVSVSLPQIVKDLHGEQYLSWVIAGYLLTSSSTMPLYGKFSDIYGRRICIQVAFFLFFVGSFLCGFSNTIFFLIFGRAVQGIGGGGMMSLSMVLIGDIAKPAVRAKYISSVSALYAVSTVLGPLIGGGFTQYVSWRWIFFVNNPLIFVTMVVSWNMLGKIKNAQKNLSVDVIGSVLVICGTSSLVLVVTWGGTTYAWNSYVTILLIVLSVVFYAAFVIQENRHPEPIMQFRLFRIRNFAVVNCIMFLYGMSMLGVFGFLPVYFEDVRHNSPIISGLKLFPMIFGLTICSTFVGVFISKTGNFIYFPKIGMAIFCIGMGLCMKMGANTTYYLIALYLFITGIGMGFGNPIYNAIIQNSVPPQHMASSVASLAFVRQIGGSIGISISGTVYSRYSSYYAKRYANIYEAEAKAFHHVFLDSVCCGIVAFLLTFAIENVQIFARKPKPSVVESTNQSKVPDDPTKNNTQTDVEMAGGADII